LKRNLHAGKKPNGGLGFQVFTEDELNDIHQATLEVLEKTGLFFDDEEALSPGHARGPGKNRAVF